MNLMIFAGDLDDSIIICIGPDQQPFLRKVLDAGDRLFVQVPKGSGNRLAQHLTTYGIESVVSCVDGVFDRLEIDGDNYPSDVQEAVDYWRE